MKCSLKVILTLLMISLDIVLLESTEDAKFHSEIISLLKKWSEDFNAKNVPAVCGLFATDLIATYPGAVDRNYESMCHHMSTILTDSAKQFRYEAPDIEQIIVEGDLAVVRLIWTLKIAGKKGVSSTGVSSTKERGLDIFKRQADGSWKIAISYAYPKAEN